jgi:hypothetical protein
LVSSKPFALSPGIVVAGDLLVRGILIGAESSQIDGGRELRRRPELLSIHETSAPVQRNQFADLPTVPRDVERLAMLDGVHDLLRPYPKVPLTDFGLATHLLVVALSATW